MTLENADVACDAGEATNSCGIWIHKPGVTVRVIGGNKIANGIYSHFPMTIEGGEGSALEIKTDSPGWYGIHAAGLTIHDADINIQVGGKGNPSRSGIVVGNNDSQISGSKIEITMESEPKDGDRAINAYDALLEIEDSEVIIHEVSEGIRAKKLIAQGSRINVDNSTRYAAIGCSEELELIDSPVNAATSSVYPAMSAGRINITDCKDIHAVSTGSMGIWCTREDLRISGSNLTVESLDQALYAENISITASSDVNVESKTGEGIWCKNGSFEISGSVLTAKGYDSALAVGSISMTESDVKVDSQTNKGIWCSKKEEKSEISESKLTAKGGAHALFAEGDVSVSSSVINMEAEENTSMWCAKDLEITGTTLQASSNSVFSDRPGLFAGGNISIKDSSEISVKSQSSMGIFCGSSLVVEGSAANIEGGAEGILASGDVTLRESNVTSVGSEASGSIQADGNIIIGGGTTETGGGKISARGDEINISGAITSNGTPFYDNITGKQNTTIILPPADYNKLDEALSKAEKLNKEDYTDFETVEEAIKAAKAIKAEADKLDIRDQSNIDACADALNKAMDALIKKDPPVKDPENPDNPDTPDTPDTPDKPDTPDQPDAPDTPDKPDSPDQPDNPDTPDKPDTPDTPGRPDVPDTPDTPDTPENPGIPETPENPALSKSDIEKSTIKLNAKAQAIPSGSKLKVTWGKVSLADGYDIYAEKCGNRMALVKSIKGSGKTNFSITRIGRKKISQKAAYKIQIRAYRTVNGKKQIIAKSLTLHTAGKAQKNYTNVKNLKASKTKITLKTGVSKKVTAKLAKQNSKKKLFPKSHVAAYRYYTTDQSVASVSKNGIVRGKKKGNCTVYIVAANGMKKGIKVTVK